MIFETWVIVLLYFAVNCFRKALRAALILFPLLGIPNLLGALVQPENDPKSTAMCAYVLVNGTLQGFQVMKKKMKILTLLFTSLPFFQLSS